MGIKDPAEDTEEEDQVEDDAQTDNVGENNLADKTDDAKRKVLADKAKEAAVHDAVQRSRAALQERKMTRAEAETTPEALKVKRAKAHAAYNENRGDAVPRQLYDVKVD